MFTYLKKLLAKILRPHNQDPTHTPVIKLECTHLWDLISDPMTTTAETAVFECMHCKKQEGL